MRDDEVMVRKKARELLESINSDRPPVDLSTCASSIGAIIQKSDNLPPQECGQTIPCRGGQSIIVVNASHLESRQRFTIAHEIGHIMIKQALANSERRLFERDLNRFSNKPREEHLCDLFAAELLLPPELLKVSIRRQRQISMSVIESLAAEFQASLTATGLRYAQMSDYDCAFIISEDLRLRYVAKSPSFPYWVHSLNSELDSDTFAHDLFRGNPDDYRGIQDVDGSAWLEDGRIPEEIKEDSRFFPVYNQVISLIWNDD